MPKKLPRFWQELKRRNVVRVITVYAGAAFVIIELINNITDPLHLPDWTPAFVIVLLAIGFPIVIIFSWIYDINPEGGMVKTEPADKVKDEVPKSSNGWKIASYISFVVIVGLIVLNIFPRANNKKEIKEKSIAVLPFINDSPEESQTYDRKTSEIFELQSKIAQLVAKEIKAIVTEDEKQIIERIPTQNSVAYDLYLKARDQYNFFIDDREKNDAINWF